jgi:hypothetical protein
MSTERIMELLTNSRRSCFQRCRREHYYDYILGWRPLVKNEALGFGQLFHCGLEQWWLAYQDMQKHLDPLDADPHHALRLALAGIEAGFYGVAEEAELNYFHLRQAQELMRGYHYRWAPTMAEIEVLEVEVKFESALVNPVTGRPSRTFRLGGRLDAIIRYRDHVPILAGRVYIVEHKTTSADLDPSSDYWLRLRIDGQVSTYYNGAKAMGHEVRGCLYDVVRKPTLKPKLATPEENRKYTKGKGCKVCGGKIGVQGAGRFELPAQLDPESDDTADFEECVNCNGTGWVEAPHLYKGQRAEDETPDEYGERICEAIADDPNKFYGRADVVRLEADLAEYMADTWYTAHAMRLAKNLDAHPRNPDACVRYGRFCSYFDVCTGVCDIDDENRFRQSPVVHEELQAPNHSDSPKEEGE